MGNKRQHILADKNLVVIFCYAPAGLGHLRVTDALFHGLPKEVEPLILGAQDEFLTYTHRITSIHPWLRSLMEWLQRGKPETVFTLIYRWWLRHSAAKIENQLATIVEQRVHKPKNVLVIATHFGLAHQIGAIKERFSQEHKVKLKLVVQVTDDSPQQMWYIEDADLIVAPSYLTKRKLELYGEKAGLKKTKLTATSYPISGKLNENLPKELSHKRNAMFTALGEEKIVVAIPISGAAVGLKYFIKLVDYLKINSRFVFVVVCKAKLQTEMFLGEMLKRDNVEVVAAGSDREIVDKYEQLYVEQVVGAEVTKPSEQAFKALISPQRRGGSLLFLSEPVGRQEYDNLNFLERHGLIPQAAQQQKMWRLAAANEPVDKENRDCACGWRGLRLPKGARESARYIDWCFKNGVLAKMLECEAKAKTEDRHRDEMRGDGVDQFWKKVSSLLLQEGNLPEG